ncbi:MAG: aromatic ring-hydroxylating dioxygenase subunit alpha [Nostocales cyanobacterium 94392]|nr:aromatic ring-hydroxylating dioxygenase subunit alpha [Nostocales cyanobacterium 94392]
MEITPILKSQTVQNRVREVGINPNYWYPAVWADQLKPNQVIPAVIWNMAIALYRSQDGQVYAIEDACPHKGIPLHKGDVTGDNITCPYHGWQFNGNGECTSIPYFPKGQKLPCAKALSYAVREKYNIIWIFPGAMEDAENVELPSVPEYDDPNWLAIPIPGHFQAHFSICNENTMDVFHGYLHKNLQGWFDPELVSLQATEASVEAQYKVSYQGWMTKFFGFSDTGNEVTTRTVTIRYKYPHYHSSLEGVSSIYLMRQPVGTQLTKSFSLLFIKIRLPQWFVKPLQKPIAKIIWWFVLKSFLDQDVEMIESEQRTYLANPQRRYVEINPAIIALQRVIVGQYEKFMQQSKKLSNGNNENYASSSTFVKSNLSST